MKHEQINESIAETVFRWPHIYDVRGDIVDTLGLRPSITYCMRGMLTRPPPSSRALITIFYNIVSARMVLLFFSSSLRCVQRIWDEFF